MRTLPTNFILSLGSCFLIAQLGLAQSILIDHTCADLTRVPVAAIEAAKTKLHIGYGHTSHGSQLTAGMTGLVQFANQGGYGLSVPQNLFAWNNGGTDGALDLEEGDGYGNGWLHHDAGYYPDWVEATRTYLNDPSHADINVIMWSWCGQLSWKSEQAVIDEYLGPMVQLEMDFPGVKFVYMTGHLDGSGPEGPLHQRNEQIRRHCRAGNRVLYDFADLESYDPEGTVNYMELNGNDNCDYDAPGGSRNWALDWQQAHQEGLDWFACDSAHSQPLNANRKACAAWWLFARLGGWPGPEGNEEAPPIQLSILPVPQPGNGCFLLRWTSVAAHTYAIYQSPDLANWEQLGAPLTGTPPLNELQVPEPDGPAATFFKVSTIP